MMDDTLLTQRAYQRLFDDVNSNLLNDVRPLLAHYTSLEVLEQILKNQEIWFSNPLLMNDHDEVRFGIRNGFVKLGDSDLIEDALNKDMRRYDTFLNALNHYLDHFEQNHMLDTYVFCMSEHDPEDNDGLLSMWRGYGRNGRGRL